MSKQQTRKGDFPQKYNTIEDINNDRLLRPAERICEIIKHHSMCLFGVAIDISNFYETLNEKEKQLDEVKAKYSKLYVENQNLRSELREYKAGKQARLQLPLTSEERQAIKADYYEKELQYLRVAVSNLKSENKKLQEQLENGK